MRLKGAITFCKFRFNQFHFNNWYFLSAMDTGMAEWRLDKNITLQEEQWWPPGNTTGIHCKMSIGMIGRQQVWKIVLICAFTRVQVIYMMFVTTATHCHTTTLCPPFCAVCDSPCNSSPFRIKFCILFQRALCPIDCTGISSWGVLEFLLQQVLMMMIDCNEMLYGWIIEWIDWRPQYSNWWK